MQDFARVRKSLLPSFSLHFPALSSYSSPSTVHSRLPCFRPPLPLIQSGKLPSGSGRNSATKCNSNRLRQCDRRHRLMYDKHVQTKGDSAESAKIRHWIPWTLRGAPVTQEALSITHICNRCVSSTQRQCISRTRSSSRRSTPEAQVPSPPQDHKSGKWNNLLPNLRLCGLPYGQFKWLLKTFYSDTEAVHGAV